MAQKRFNVGDWIVVEQPLVWGDDVENALYQVEKIFRVRTKLEARNFWTKKVETVKRSRCRKATEEEVSEAVSMRLRGEEPYRNTLAGLFKKAYSGYFQQAALLDIHSAKWWKVFPDPYTAAVVPVVFPTIDPDKSTDDNEAA